MEDEAEAREAEAEMDMLCRNGAHLPGSHPPVPLNKYEGWLDDPNLAGMDVQLPCDDSASMYPYFAGFPALTLLVFYFFSKTRREKLIVLSVIGILLVVWVIKFCSLLFGA